VSEIGGDDYWLSLLVRTALDSDQRSGYAKMLRTVAKSVNCDACTVWRVVPGSDLNSNPPAGRLFALAQWSEKGNVWTTHDLSFTSATGLAVLSGKPDLINDIHHHVGVDPHDNFFSRTGMKKFCTIPILFTSDKGAVAIYRLADNDISPQEFARAQLLAEVLPLLYRTIRDRAGFLLIGEVNERLRQAEANAVAPEEAMGRVCDSVKTAFGCRETSVFLENPHEKRGVYHCYYTTERLFVGDKVDYIPPEPGLTPWVLENRRGVQIFDLRHFQQDKARIQERYPHISWEDRQGVVHHAARRPLAGSPAPQQAPVSFMAAPIMIGSEVRGAIRCCLADEPPYYFALRELQLLELVASRISQYWGHRLALAHLAGSFLELKTATDQQARAYIDLEHQLKSPLITALRWVQKGVADKTETDLFALRAQIKRAYRVSRNVALFADLAGGQRPPIRPARLNKDKTVRSLFEYCTDFRGAAQKGLINFLVHPDGFEHLEKYDVQVDSALFDHAINNVLDNAFKYSYISETVEVSADVEDDSWFFISIRNKGVPIRPDEVANCTIREWRSEAAKSVTGEGSGIGLWIVDEIMKRHAGALVIYATKLGITEVRLRWPCQKSVLP